MRLDCGYRLDLVVDGKVIVEIKAVDRLTSACKAQLLSYHKLSQCRVGLLINFNAEILKEGIVRVAYQFPEPPRPCRARQSEAAP